jgi:hypothetical protein
VRGFISGRLGTKLGLTVESAKPGNERVYNCSGSYCPPGSGRGGSS